MQRKCDMYWPKAGTELYGLMEVTLEREDVMATYTVRHFRLRHTRIRTKSGSSCERAVLQFHYTSWPDHGTPENPLPILSFVKRSAEANREHEGPIVVHCSAGVGRTGAYILIDSMLRQMRSKGEVNIFAFLKHVRSQRNYLVQTEEQFVFVHDAIAEAVAAGETSIPAGQLSRYICSLQSSFTTDENSIPWQLLDRQFKLATAYQPQENQFMAALKPCNQVKNQNFDYLPIESARVPISPKVGLEGSDYINASWLPGHQKLKEFVITQHPTEQTCQDFWQLLWDHNIHSVVVLSVPQQQPEFGVFWPASEVDLEFDSLRVRLIEETLVCGYQSKDFALLSPNEEYELLVKLVFCPAWPHHCSPLNTNLVQVVREVHSAGPVVVMDRFGGTEAATFCAITTLIKQLEYEQCVDVYQYAKVSHNRRPGIWRSQDDILLIYRALEAICSGGHFGGGHFSNGHLGSCLPNSRSTSTLPRSSSTMSTIARSTLPRSRNPPDGREAVIVGQESYQRY